MFFKVIFLSLTILFSFGFTTKMSSCECNKNVKEPQGCCSKSDNKTKNKPCKGSYCIKTQTFSKIEEIIFENNDVRKKQKERTKNYFSNINKYIYSTYKTKRVKFLKTTFIVGLKTRPYQSKSKQVWLI